MARAPRTRSFRAWLRCAAAGVALGSCFALTGCAPGDPLDIVVEARTEADYNHWLYRSTARLGPELEREFHDLEKERLLALQIEQAGLPPDELRRRLRIAFDGRPLREVLSEGYLLRRKRLLEDDRGDTYLLDVNHALIVHPQVQEDLAAHRFGTMEKIAKRQAGRRTQIAAIEARLRQLNPDGAIERLLAPATPPPPGHKREKGVTF